MATISAKEFFGGKPAVVVGNEASPTYRQSVVKPKPVEPNPIVSGVTEAVTMARNKAQSQAKKLGDQFATAGENIKKNVGRIIDLDDEKTDDLSYNLGKRLMAGGHIAGDVAATAFAIPATVAGIVIPDKVKKSVMEFVSKDIQQAKVKELTTEKGRKTASNRQAVKEWWNTLNDDNKEALAKDIPSLLGLLGSGKSTTLNPSLDDLTNPFKSAPGGGGGSSGLATAVNESTTGMQRLYSSADPNIKFDGSMPIPQEVSDHILDDIALKFEKIYKKPLAAEQIRTLAGKPYNSLDEIKSAAMNLLDDADDVVASTQTVPMLDRVRTSLAENNVNSNLKTSATRLAEDGVRRQGIGQTKLKSPVETYDEFFAQEQKFKGDAKQDMALSISGERIGNAFENVVQQRRSAGKAMGEELKKVGNIKTDITDSFASLETELADQGLVYDATKKTLSPSKTSKVTSQDQALIKKYIGELNALGANPSIAELDAFLSRLPKEVDVYKGKNNITSVTNGERIIKSHLNELRSQLSPEKSGNEALRAYSDARKSYADLTNFLDEGQSFLGKKTQAGDYAKDASLAKSAAISILNNGKKDWLLRLEELTGYPALDEAVLALQAMKDAGNPQGLSLLEKVMQGGVPTSKGDIWGRILDFGVSKANRMIVGTPDEQTRAFLRSLEQPKTPTNPVIPADTTKTTTPKTSGKLDTTDNPQRGSVANPFFKSADEVEPLAQEAEILRGTKGLTADDIMKTHPNIKLTKDVPAKDIYGNKVVIPDGEALTPYELKGNKVLLQDGETYIVSKNQFDNIKGNAIGGEPKPFAPELDALEESVKSTGGKTLASAAKELFSKSWQELDDSQKALVSQHLREIDTAPTKYSQYTLPGGENYREVLIKAPQQTGKVYQQWQDYITELKGKYGDNFYNSGKLSTAEKSKLESLHRQAGNGAGEESLNFKSSHWDEPNVISHLRLNERTYNGKKVTFMEELQSDWAREARKASDEVSKERAMYERDLRLLETEPNVVNREAKVAALKEKLEDMKSDEPKIPNNPLLKNWQELSVKRALKEAVDNDSEYFAWINGEQTSARYNLAKQVKSVDWFQNDDVLLSRSIKIVPDGVGSKEIQLFVDPKTGEITKTFQHADPSWKGKKLDEVLGKGLADKIMEKETGTLSGEGLKFGGEWANNLYDKQVKNIIEDLTGGKVETLDLGLPVEGKGKIWLDITDKMKKDWADLPPLDGSKLKVGKNVWDGNSEYIITDVLGDGKFKAVPKEDLSYASEAKDIWGENWERNYNRLGEKVYPKGQAKEFDISQKTTTQQGIKLTPEIKAKIRGEGVEIKTSGKMFEDGKSGATPKKVGTGDFGDIYEGPKGNEAVSFLLKNKKGEVKGAFSHPDIEGEIDIPFGKTGDDGFGLAHIQEKHPEMVKDLEKSISSGRVFKQAKDRVLIISEDATRGKVVAVRLDWNGEDKRWVVSAFEKL